MKLEILDAKGALVRKSLARRRRRKRRRPTRPATTTSGFGAPPPKPLPAKAGLNSFSWDLRYAEASKFKGLILWAGQTAGPRVVPGRYEVRLTAAGQTLSQPFEVRKDPRLDDERRRLREAAGAAAARSATSSRPRTTRSAGCAACATRRRRRPSGPRAARPRRPSRTPRTRSRKKLTAVEEALYQTKNRSSQDPLNYPIRLNNKLAALAGSVGSADAAPTEQAYAVYDELKAQIDAELQTLERVLAEDVPAFNRLVREKEIPAVRVPKP